MSSLSRRSTAKNAFLPGSGIKRARDAATPLELQLIKNDNSDVDVVPLLSGFRALQDDCSLPSTREGVGSFHTLWAPTWGEGSAEGWVSRGERGGRGGGFCAQLLTTFDLLILQLTGRNGKQPQNCWSTFGKIPTVEHCVAWKFPVYFT